MRRSRALFDLVSGFVYTQTLLACVELNLFEYLAGGARTLDEIAEHTNLSRANTERLLNAAVSLRLMMKRRHGRYALGALGAPLVSNTGVLALIRHHRMAYQDLSDPVALLRQGADFRTELSRYWSYADAPRPQQIDDARVAAYSEIMADTLPPVAHDVLEPHTGAAVCECKSPYFRPYEHPKFEHIVQMYVQMRVYNVRKCYYICWFRGRCTRIWRVRWSHAFWSWLYIKMSIFWRRMTADVDLNRELFPPIAHACEELVANGWRVRIYTPYGPDWWPYSLRRMAERPANLRFVLRSLVGR